MSVKIKILIALIIAVITFIFMKNNITPSNLGVVDGRLSAMPNSPNAVSSQTDVEDKKVEPLEFEGNLNESNTKIINIINSYANSKIITQSDNYIHIVFQTSSMHFKDDVEFYFDTKNKLIHFRSASRLGYSDMGVNKERYNEIKLKYNSAQ